MKIIQTFLSQRRETALVLLWTKHFSYGLAVIWMCNSLRPPTNQTSRTEMQWKQYNFLSYSTMTREKEKTTTTTNEIKNEQHENVF